MQFKLPSKEALLEIHSIVIEYYGGLEGILHPESIEAALNRPKNFMTYDDKCDVHLVAAIILSSIARMYHIFTDGNKRTSLIATLITYRINGVDLDISLHTNKKFEKLVLEVSDEKQREIPIKVLRKRLQELVDEFITTKAIRSK